MGGVQSRALGKCLSPGYQLVPCLASRARRGLKLLLSSLPCAVSMNSVLYPAAASFRSQGSRAPHLLSFTYTRVMWLILTEKLCKLQTTNNMQLTCVCVSVTKNIACTCVHLCCMYRCVYTYTCVLVHVEVRRQSWAPFLMSLPLFV